MSLSQTQIIRSLSEALQWFEKELAWGAPIAELRHLTGRIGELYAAMITRGQLALSVNQAGYDVVSAEGEKISVKTFTSSTRINFNANTLDHVGRVGELAAGGEIHRQIEARIEEETFQEGRRDLLLQRLPVFLIGIDHQAGLGLQMLVFFGPGECLIDCIAGAQGRKDPAVGLGMSSP